MNVLIKAIFEDESIQSLKNSISFDVNLLNCKSPYITSLEAQQRQQRVHSCNEKFHEFLLEESLQLNLSRNSIHLKEFEKGNFNLGVIMKESTLTLQKCTTNIDCQNTLTIRARLFMKGSQLQLESRNVKGQAVEKYKYTLTGRRNSVLARVYLPLNEKEFKLWKQMDLPITGDALIVEIKEISSKETIFKVNSFQLRLLAQMPLIKESYFTLSNTLHFEGIDLRIQNVPRIKTPQANSCDNDCCII